jgi:murein L,D-transpeptidase YafK
MSNRLLLPASVALVLALAACQDQSSLGSNKHLAPIPPATTALMASKGMAQGDPVLMRSYKKESELEVWKKGRDGKYAFLKTYPICRWSGQLGPKVREGDRQAPEGFYTVTPAQMNPNSSYYLSFDTGFPNAYDRAHGRTGSHLMVHGTCSSRGCFAMTDEAISEVYAIAREAFAGGQRGFQFQSYPFRMTAENLAKHRADPNMAFWRNLKEGADQFEVLKEEPRVSVAGGRYDFGAEHPAVAQKRAQDEQKVAELVGTGVPAVRTVYDDGGGHGSFHKAMVATAGDDGDSRSALAFLDARASRNLGDVSRPEALAAGPREVPVETPAKGKDRGQAKGQVAAATAAPAPNATTATASAQASAGETKSFYQRALGLFGKGEEPAPVASEPAKPAAAAPAVPPRRGASSAPGAKPQAATAAPERRASLPASALPGSQPVLPAGDGGFSRLN